MDIDLTDEECDVRRRAREFAHGQIDPIAAAIDFQETTPSELLAALGTEGWLGAALPTQYGGGGLDPVSYGLATEEIGRASAAVRSLMTVHNMASQAVVRFGTAEQHARWLPAFGSGSRTIAFALTEPEVGSAANDVRCRAIQSAGGVSLSGTKVWVTYGQIADMFLVIARDDDGPTAYVLERDMPGLSLTPIADALGTRGSMLARLDMDGVRVPASHRLGARGAGIRFVANTVLDHGRFSVAWGATAIVRACLEASTAYAVGREQGGRALAEHQLIRRHLTDILVLDTTARAICMRSARYRRAGHPHAAAETALAKYHAAEAAQAAAAKAVTLHGANGCSAEFPVARYLRDAAVTIIIEGTPEMHQITLASHAIRRADATR